MEGEGQPRQEWGAGAVGWWGWGGDGGRRDAGVGGDWESPRGAQMGWWSREALGR